MLAIPGEKKEAATKWTKRWEKGDAVVVERGADKVTDNRKKQQLVIGQKSLQSPSGEESAAPRGFNVSYNNICENWTVRAAGLRSRGTSITKIGYKEIVDLIACDIHFHHYFEMFTFSYRISKMFSILYLQINCNRLTVFENVLPLNRKCE